MATVEGPSAKEKKYDRQLRLWGASGQEKLESAKVLLVMPGPRGPGLAGIETLKNLILPGIGSYTILDTAVVAQQDIEINFFLEAESLGKQRASECCRLLQDLNTGVQGSYSNELPERFVEQKEFRSITVILIASPIDNESLQAVQRAAEKRKIPLFYIQSVGEYARINIALPAETGFIDTHPDSTVSVDLRLLKPWPELVKKARESTEDLETQNDHDHGHVPYLYLLLHYLDVWHKEHGRYPSNYKEKSQFRELVRSGMRGSGEENFEEAIAAIIKHVYTDNPLNSEQRALFTLDPTRTIAPTPFGIITQAVARFYQQHGLLPLPGNLPDMKAQSDNYIQLQNLYRTKAREDVAEVSQTVKKIVDELETQLSPPKLAVDVSHSDIEIYCKNAAFVRPVQGYTGSALGADVRYPSHGNDYLWGKSVPLSNPLIRRTYKEMQDPESLMLLNIALISYAEQIANNPEAIATEKDLGWPSLREAIRIMHDAQNVDNTTATKPPTEALDEASTKQILLYMEEIGRWGNCEDPNTAAFTGGMAAQEVKKIVMTQYVPAANTIVWDGINSRTAVFKMYPG